MMIDHNTTKLKRASCIEQGQAVAEKSIFEIKNAFVKVSFSFYLDSNKRRSGMETIRKISKPASILLAFYMLMLSGPYQSAWAAIIGTEAIIDEDGSQRARDYLNHLLAREDIQAALVSQGLDPKEARARIDSLSDAEVNEVVNKLDQLPAGGIIGTILIIAFLVFLILLLTDIAGYTDVFPFVKKK